MDDIMKSIHEHKLGVQSHLDNHNAQLRGEGIEKGKKLPVGTVSNGRKKVAEGKWTTVNESTGTSKLQDSERMNSVNSMWSKFDKEFKSKNLHSKTLNMPNEKVAKQFKEDFKASNFKDKYSLKENPTNKLSISITKKYADKSIEGDVDLQKGAMTAGNIYAKNPKHEVKKKIDKMFDPETEEDEDEVKKESNPCWDGYEMAGMKDKNGKKVPNCVPKKGTTKKGYINKNHGSGCGIKKGQLVIEEADRLSKGKKMPIGTVSNGRKKVAEGKWVDVKDSSSSSKTSSGTGEKELRAEVKQLKAAYEKMSFADPKKSSARAELKAKQDKLKEMSAKRKASEKKEGSGGPKGSHNVERNVPVADITSKYSYLKSKFNNVGGSVDIHVVDRDTSAGGSQDKYKMEAWQNGKKVADLGSHPSKTGMKWKKDGKKVGDLSVKNTDTKDSGGKEMTAGAKKQYKEFDKEFNQTPKEKQSAYIERLKVAVKKVEASGSAEKSQYGKDLLTAAKKLIGKHEGSGNNKSIEKGVKLPIGTISRGMKKIAEGKWVRSDNKKSESKKEMKPSEHASKKNLSLYNYQNVVRHELKRIHGEKSGEKIFTSASSKIDQAHKEGKTPSQLVQSFGKSDSKSGSGKKSNSWKDHMLSSKLQSIPSELREKSPKKLEKLIEKNKEKLKSPNWHSETQSIRKEIKDAQEILNAHKKHEEANKSIEGDIDLTKAISDFDSLIKGDSENRDRALMKKLGLEGYNKPKRTPNHPTKSHVVFAKEGNVTKLIRFGEQGAKTAGSPKEGESEAKKMQRKKFKSRHGKNIAIGKLSGAYWSDKVKW